MPAGLGRRLSLNSKQLQGLFLGCWKGRQVGAGSQSFTQDQACRFIPNLAGGLRAGKGGGKVKAATEWTSVGLPLDCWTWFGILGPETDLLLSYPFSHASLYGEHATPLSYSQMSGFGAWTSKKPHTARCQRLEALGVTRLWTQLTDRDDRRSPGL